MPEIISDIVGLLLPAAIATTLRKGWVLYYGVFHSTLSSYAPYHVSVMLSSVFQCSFYFVIAFIILFRSYLVTIFLDYPLAIEGVDFFHHSHASNTNEIAVADYLLNDYIQYGIWMMDYF